MSELRIETYRVPTVPLGPEKPFPNFDPPHYQPLLSGKSQDDPEAGYLPDYLPYTVQDGYTRDRQPTDLKVAVLENDILRATFLLDYGGRLWSLIHKPSGRELLYVNPILQPANLAMRNAWFSGGVEWNMGVMAHTPLTCAPMFAAHVDGPDGIPILRLYEWERIRQAAYQIDAYLPDGSPVLYIHCRIVNPFDYNLPMYWWSNIAVEEREDVRVIVPADSSYRYALSVSDLSTVQIPMVDGQDISHTTTGWRAADYFFLIPPGARPWVTALDRDGKGLIQVSTDLLRGRKLFLWGTGPGGKRWQEWLSGPDHAYLEIQAGLAPTQLEYALVPAKSEIVWLEGYGLMEANSQIVHGDDWQAAYAEVGTHLEALVPRAAFDAELQRGMQWADQTPSEILHRGSGWGELEALRCAHAGQRPFAGAGLDFRGALGAQQQPWLDLLRTGHYPDSASDSPIGGILVQSEWRALLEAAVRRDPNAGWEAWLHLGMVRLHDGEREGARAAWENSLKQRRTAWALRNLAVLARLNGQVGQAANLYREAQALRPDLMPLLIETGRALIDAGQSAEFLHLLESLPLSMRDYGRIHLLEVEAGLAVGDLDRVGRLLLGGFEIIDYREGDEILMDLWYRYNAEQISRAENIPVDDTLLKRVYRDYPPPSIFDFRMKAKD